MATWDELKRAIPDLDERELRTSSEGDLDAFEVARGVKLPSSYREFAKTFGRCMLGGGCWEFAVPSIEAGDDSRFDLTSFDRIMHGHAMGDTSKYVNTKTPEIARRLVFFSSDEGGDSYGWDVGEVTDAGANEYAIYGRFDAVYKRVASSFVEFVMSHCLGEDLDASNVAEDEAAVVFFDPN